MSSSGRLRLSTADYSFPLLEWEQTRDLGMDGMDISLFEGRSHLRPDEVLSNPALAAKNVCAAMDRNGLEIADVFGIPGKSFDQNAPNDPDPANRRKSADYFYRILEFTARLNSRHVTLLPGVHFSAESHDDSLKRSAEELEWRASAANKIGISFAVEAHMGSVAPDTATASRLLEMAPSLTVTLDPSYFTCQGIGDNEIEILTPRTSHFQAPCARPGRLQAPFKENEVDFGRYVRSMTAQGYKGWYAVEYVWIDWEHCNEVDNLSETILLKDHLRALSQ